MRTLLTLLLTLFGLYAYAQDEDIFYRLELGGGVGTSLNFTDVGDKPGVAGAAIARFPLNPRMAVKAQFTYNSLKGSTDNASSFIPANPDAAGAEQLSYSVSSAVYDLSALYELHFLPYGYWQDYRGYKRVTPYIQMGLGLTYGQAGKAFTLNVPIGLGVKFKAAKRLNLGLDWMVHFSLSDKLDGLNAPLGIKSSEFRNKDHYSALTLTLTYDLSPVCPTCNKDQ